MFVVTYHDTLSRPVIIATCYHCGIVVGTVGLGKAPNWKTGDHSELW